MRTVEDNKLCSYRLTEITAKHCLKTNFCFYCCTACQNPREEFDTVNGYIKDIIHAIDENKGCVTEILEPMLRYISYNFDFLRWGLA